jgi:EAL domain-containing protein (putative c-di-GMP-specific phosphodiesterase class I)
MLKQTAERLSQAMLPTATVARLGGDEFGVLCEGLDDARDAVAVAARIHDSLAPPVLVAGTEVYISASIGVASAHDLDPERLLRDADSAMSRAKDLGRSRTEMFDVTLRGAAEARLRMRTELRQALEREEFVLHFQPIIDLTTEHVVGLEALVRWNHPQRGLVPPLEFIPVAEETGIIADLGDWVLAETCRALRDMPPSAPGQHPLQASVNLSARQISRPDVVERVARVIEATGVDPSRLVLEVTESAVMEDAEAALRALVALKSLGVRLAIDDFGTGYSSLVYLKRFPVDELKIDRSFVDGLCADADDAAIVASVISLAGSVGLRAVAEGVETSDQLLALRNLGCDLAQGYFWSRPLPVAELRQFIARR